MEEDNTVEVSKGLEDVPDVEMEDISEKNKSKTNVGTNKNIPIQETSNEDKIIEDITKDIRTDSNNKTLEESKKTDNKDENNINENIEEEKSIEISNEINLNSNKDVSNFDDISESVQSNEPIDDKKNTENKEESKTSETTNESSKNIETSETLIESSIESTTKTNNETLVKLDEGEENETLIVNSDGESETSFDENEEEYDGTDLEYEICSEGKAFIYIPAGKKGVFYNPVQEFNRDLSVAVLTVFAKDHLNDPTVKKFINKKNAVHNTSDTDEEHDETEGDLPPKAGRKCNKGLVILDALSATGLRSMRYGVEVPGVNTVMANDMSKVAVNIIDKNVKLNHLEKIVFSRHFDAIDLMQLERIRGRHFDAIDLDPFGNPTRFLDAAVGSLRDGGLLLVTCTDMAILCGNTPESCYVKYNSVSLKTAACHEMALRICLHLIETVCSKYGRYIQPVLSFHADFYIRVFVKVFTSPHTCKSTSSKTSMVFKCTGCNKLSFQPLGIHIKDDNGKNKFNLNHGPVVNQRCVHCEGRHVMAGPIWTGPLHDTKFVEDVLKTSIDLKLATTRRIVGMLSVILEEIKDIPLYYTLPNLCSVLHCEVIPMQEFRSALLHAKYKVSLSHCCKNSFKTNASMDVIWDILRCWIKKHPIAEKRYDDGVVKKILAKEPTLEANFDHHEDSIAQSTGLLRFQPNPQPFWGPGRKSQTNTGDNMKPRNKKTHSNTFDTSDDSSSSKPKRFKSSNEISNSNNDDHTVTSNTNNIELITLSDEEEGDNNDGNNDTDIINTENNDVGDSLDEEIFSLRKNNIENINEKSNQQGKSNEKKEKVEKIIEEYDLCDDDDDELTVVNGESSNYSNHQVDPKVLEKLEKELNDEIYEFNQRQKLNKQQEEIELKQQLKQQNKNQGEQQEREIFDIDDEIEEQIEQLNKDTKNKEIVEEDDDDDDILEVNESNELITKENKKINKSLEEIKDEKQNQNDEESMDVDLENNEQQNNDKLNKTENEEIEIEKNNPNKSKETENKNDDQINKDKDVINKINENISSNNETKTIPCNLNIPNDNLSEINKVNNDIEEKINDEVEGTEEEEEINKLLQEENEKINEKEIKENEEEELDKELDEIINENKE